ncbi:MAG: hypothetical protein NTY02_02675 [Acidobacteria bacterium]|nr:hypothetical protein [Acidobacteriota bacterium]
MIPGKTYTPQDVIEAAWRLRAWIAVPFMILALATLAVVMSLSRSYQSVATLQVVTDPATDAYVRTAARTQVADRISSIGQATLTRSRLEAIIRDLDLYPERQPSTVTENVIERMRSEITFKSTDRDVFVLGFTANDPQVAFAVATRLTSLFLEENARDRGQRADATTLFLDSQVADVRRKLDEQEQQLEAYRAKYAGELPSQLAFSVQEVNNSQNTVRTLLEAVSRDQDQKLLLQRQLEAAQASSAPVLTGVGLGATAGQLGGGASQLDIARASLKDLELRLTPEHPDVQRMKRVIATLERQESGRDNGAAANSAARQRDPRLVEVRGQIENLDRRIAGNQEEVRRLRARIDDYTRRVTAAPRRESELATLSRDYEDTKKLYSSLTAKQQEASMAASLERKDLGERFRVIAQAQLPEKASSQSRTSQLIIGLLVALGVSLSLAAAVEYRDSSMRTENDIAVGLRLPVLAAIPDLQSPMSGRSR